MGLLDRNPLGLPPGGLLGPWVSSTFGLKPGESLLGNGLLGNVIRGALYGGAGGLGAPNFVSGLSSGLATGAQGIVQRQQQQRQNDLYDLELEKYQRDQQQADARAAAVAKLPPPAGVDPDQWANLLRAAPDEAAVMALRGVMPRTPEPSEVAGGLERTPGRGSVASSGGTAPPAPGSQTQPATAAASAAGTTAPTRDEIIKQAADAIAKGADRAKVKARLAAMGVDPSVVD